MDVRSPTYGRQFSFAYLLGFVANIRKRRFEFEPQTQQKIEMIFPDSKPMVELSMCTVQWSYIS